MTDNKASERSHQPSALENGLLVPVLPSGLPGEKCENSRLYQEAASTPPAEAACEGSSRKPFPTC